MASNLPFAMIVKASDERLVDLIRSGLDLAFEVLVERYAAVLYWYGRQHGLSHEDAQELTQDTFMKTLSGLAAFDRQRATLKTYLFAICHNALRDRWRRKRREPDTVPLAEDDQRADALPQELSAEALFEFMQLEQGLRECTDRALASLSSEDRDLVHTIRGAGRPTNLWRQAVDRAQRAFLACFRRTFPDWKDAFPDWKDKIPNLRGMI